MWSDQRTKEIIRGNKNLIKQVYKKQVYNIISVILVYNHRIVYNKTHRNIFCFKNVSMEIGVHGYVRKIIKKFFFCYDPVWIKWYQFLSLLIR